MTAIALIGGDGAGKTTVAEALIADFSHPVKYLYMGANASSSNISLPTTRLLYSLKVRKERRDRSRRGEEVPEEMSWTDIDNFNAPRGRLWAAARLVNRIAEEIVRQAVSWFYQARGFLVVYDRHFLFDFSTAGPDRRRLSERIHRWWLENLYPKPQLAIFLDADPEVLLERKVEVSARYLHARREAFLQRGATLEHFHVVDASQPFDTVYARVTEIINSYLARR